MSTFRGEEFIVKRVKDLIQSMSGMNGVHRDIRFIMH